MSKKQTRKSVSSKKGERNITRILKKVRNTFRKPSASPPAQDTSGKLKAVHGRAAAGARKLRQKRGQSAWHKEFYKNAPASRFKRTLWFLHPKQQYKFWFSKEGLKTGAKYGLVGLAAFFILGLGVYAYYSRGLPSPEEISRRLVDQTTKFYDRTGTILLYEVYGSENRTVVEFDQISEHAKEATIAIEDKNFYDHNGISVSGIIRSAYKNAMGDNLVGGSTITQQFVKNSLLTNEKTYERKIKEAILALELERIYTKDEILGFYLNEVPYGGTAYGIESAAGNYFAKSAADLTIDEAATLAAMIQRPTFFSPYSDNTDALIERRNFVIDLMFDQGFISAEERDEAKATDTIAKVGSKGREIKDIKAPHFVLEAQRRLEDKYGSDTLAKGGLTVITSIDMKLQEIAEKSIADGMQAVEAVGGNNAAMSVTDPATGHVIAQVGSRDFTYPKFGNFNAALSRQQPGSSFKPYEYAKMMEGNWGAGSIMYDLRTDFGGGYEPNNYDSGFKGANTVRNHLGSSRNIPAIKALYIAGMDSVIDQVEKQGVSLVGDSSDYGLALGLGAGDVLPAEHVHGFSVFANKGVYKEQTYILKVTNSIGEVLEEWEDSEGEEVIDPEIAYIISDILSDAKARSPLTFNAERRNNLIVDGVETAVKTGTTNDARDIWTMGYSTKITAGVWVGHSENIELRTGASSSRQPAAIWDSFMTEAHKLSDYKDAPDFEAPEGIKTVTLDRITGRAPIEGSNNGVVRDIFPSWFKLDSAQAGEPFEIDTVSGKLATDCTPPLAKQTVRVGGVSAEISPTDPAFGRWNAPVQAYARSVGNAGNGVAVKPTATDDVHKCGEAKPSVEITSESSSDSGSYTIIASAKQGAAKLKSIEFKVDGRTTSAGAREISNSGNYSEKVNLSSGSHTIEVIVTDQKLYQNSAQKKVAVNSDDDNELSAVSPSGTNQGSVTFVWTTQTGAKSYKVIWEKDGPGGDGSDDVNGGNSTTLTKSLSNGRYTWYVEAYSETNGGGTLLATSGKRSFIQAN